MATFTYCALDRSGRRVSGTVEGPDATSVRRQLRGQGLYVISLDSREQQARVFSARVQTEELAVAIREFATLLGSGIPLDDCLTGLISQMRHGRLRHVFETIHRDIQEGKSLSQAMRAFPGHFSEMIVSMVRAGEESGTLEMILSRTADSLEREQAFRNRLISIMTYPALMVIVAAGVLIFILSFVTPTITRIFLDMGVALPVPTRILMKTSVFFKHTWVGLLIVGVSAPSALMRFSATRRGRMFLDRLRLQFPFLRDIFIKADIALFCRTLGTLLDGGVDILEALGIAQKVVYSPSLQEEVGRIREFLSRGGSLAGGFQSSSLFPYLVTQLVGAGEKSGELSQMFDKISRTYEEEVSQKSARILSLVEPLMILVMGIAVGFIVLAVLLPIFQISQALR